MCLLCSVLYFLLWLDLIEFTCFAANNRTSDSQYDALITSNLVPMYEAFKSKYIFRLLI